MVYGSIFPGKRKNHNCLYLRFWPQGNAHVRCRPLVIEAPMLCDEILSLGRQWWFRKTKLDWAGLSVCPSILAPVVRTHGRIVTREEPFDAPGRWKDDGTNLRRIGFTCQVPRATAQDLAKTILSRLQTRVRFHQTQVLGYDAKPWKIWPMGCQKVVRSQPMPHLTPILRTSYCNSP